MTELPRPPLPETRRERLQRWGYVLLGLVPRLTPRREWVPPTPPSSPDRDRADSADSADDADREEGDGSSRFASRPPRDVADAVVPLIGGLLAVGVVIGAAFAGAAAWAAWQARSSPAVEDRLPIVSAPLVPTLPPAPSPTPAREEATRVVAHVAGAVVRPGVVELAVPARVVDAIAAAGGARSDADLDRINLAAPLLDGQHVYVVAVGEEAPPPVPVSGPTGQSEATTSGPLDINTATAGDLEALPGVGPSTAAAIIDHRTRRGPFVEPADLLDVAGIGPAKFEAIESMIMASSLVPAVEPTVGAG